MYRLIAALMVRCPKQIQYVFRAFRTLLLPRSLDYSCSFVIAQQNILPEVTLLSVAAGLPLLRNDKQAYSNAQAQKQPEYIVQIA